MKFGHFLSTCLTVLVLGACSEENVENKPAASEFRIVSSVRAVRAPQLNENGAGNFVDGDQNSVFFHTSNNKSLHKLTYEYGEKYFWNDFNLPQEVESCQISACYPVVTTATPENFAWDIQQQNNTRDFLLSAPADANTQSSKPVTLTFSHALHQLVVTLKSEADGITDDMLSKAEITCRNLHPVANLNLLKGKPINASGELISLTETGKKVSFIVPAQHVGSMEIAIKLGNREKTYPLASCQVNGKPLTELEYGKSFTLNIGVNEEHLFIIGQDINGWDNQGSADGTITIQTK